MSRVYCPDEEFALILLPPAVSLHHQRLMHQRPPLEAPYMQKLIEALNHIKARRKINTIEMIEKIID
jgi:hypothetical protein